jgi:asparagine synthase (glutamine-hydrolysing)
MCGIAGFIDRKGGSDEALLQQMTDALAHRGPDGHGAYVFTHADIRLGLGHRRLSIIDLQAAAGQPMHLDKWSIVFNGEIYNYAEIRDELLKAGRSFKTHSDTEVILHAFDEWGQACVHRFIGMFAFAICNKEAGKIWFFRDRAGVKPFYYYHTGELFLFASELKALHCHPGFRKEIDINTVAQFLKLGYIRSPHSIFRNTHTLRPGHFLEFDLSQFSFNEQEYWNPAAAYNKPKLKITETEALQHTEQLLQSAVEYRMVADVPVGMFLSGGYDSSMVAALLQHKRTEKIKTFTIGFHEKGFDEAPCAKKVAEHLGTDHTEYYCTKDDARNILPEMVHYWDEPFADPSAVPTMLVSRLAREKVTVSLSADGGDELFGGYSKYAFIQNALRKTTKIPKSIRAIASAALKGINPSRVPFTSGIYNFETRYHKAVSLISAGDEMEALAAVASLFTDHELDRLILPSFGKRLFFEGTTGIDPVFSDSISRMLCADYQTYLVDDVLTKVDRATMHTGLEGREPLLDHRLLEWVAQLPSELKIKNGEKKYLLKQICHAYIPAEIMERPKKGFVIPLTDWFGPEIHAYMNAYLNEAYILQQGIFNPDEIKRIINAYEQKGQGSILRIWNLLVFQLWYEKWM